MPNNHKFYRTTYSITVLSETEPGGHTSLSGIDYEITDGDWVGMALTSEVEVVNGQRMAELLHEAGSEPAFFGLTEDGSLIDGVTLIDGEED